MTDPAVALVISHYLKKRKAKTYGKAKEADADERQENREVLIYKLHQEGKTNSEIGREVSLPPVAVSQIIRKMKNADIP